MHVAVSVDPRWDVLGPFQIGTRELPWGADPLEEFGGFIALKPDHESTFKTSLMRGGHVKWSTRTFATETTSSGETYIHVELSFPETNWNLLRAFYGWSALQYQAWVRGYMHIEASEARTFEIYPDGIAEFAVDDNVVYGGDFYRFRGAPLILQLEPGRHTINLHLYRDVRSMGGNDSHVAAGFGIRLVSTDLIIDHHLFLASDLVDGKLPSPHASVPVRNTCDDIIEIHKITSDKDSWHVSSDHLPMRLFSGQTRPLALTIKRSKGPETQVSFRVIYRYLGSDKTASVSVQYNFNQRTIVDFHKHTYPLPNGLVSWSMLRAPLGISTSPLKSSEVLPVIVFLHGASVKADDHEFMSTFDGIKNIAAWTILPSGVTSWSGDDWHQWGWMDVRAAIPAIAQWIANLQWSGPAAIECPFLLGGHSNGGQGVWYGVIHHPDRVAAAAPVAGYASIQKYVPYTFWRETDPRRSAVLHAALNSYRHELLMPNSKHVPIAQQHGADDDNVPSYHSRHLFQIGGRDAGAFAYNEIPGVGHVFDGMMTTNFLKKFWEQHLHIPASGQQIWKDFSLIVANPADTGSKSGVRVRQLLDPGQLGTIEAQFRDPKLVLYTTNVRTISLSESLCNKFEIEADECNLDTKTSRLHVFGKNGRWLAVRDKSDLSGVSGTETVRWGNQLGNLDAILRSKGRFLIQFCHKSVESLAVQISRNFFQYFSADTEILRLGEKQGAAEGHVITIALATHIPSGLEHSESRTKFPITLSESAVCIRDAFGNTRTYHTRNRSLGAIFLRPLEKERLEIVVWGTDIISLYAAARLVPVGTGGGQPDFIVLTSAIRYKGLGGALAMGFFDSIWNVTASSFLL